MGTFWSPMRSSTVAMPAAKRFIAAGAARFVMLSIAFRFVKHALDDDGRRSAAA